MTIERTIETESIKVNSFTDTLSQGGVLDQKGKRTISIGATLNITPDQKRGVYVSSSPFEIKLNYY